MFVWSSSASPVSEVSGLPDFTGGAGGGVNVGAKEIRMVIPAELPPQNGSAGKGTSAPRARVNTNASRHICFMLLRTVCESFFFNRFQRTRATVHQ
jgi:hypothetical protein